MKGSLVLPHLAIQRTLLCNLFLLEILPAGLRVVVAKGAIQPLLARPRFLCSSFHQLQSRHH